MNGDSLTCHQWRLAAWVHEALMRLACGSSHPIILSCQLPDQKKKMLQNLFHLNHFSFPRSLFIYFFCCWMKWSSRLKVWKRFVFNPGFLWAASCHPLSAKSHKEKNQGIFKPGKPTLAVVFWQWLDVTRYPAQQTPLWDCTQYTDCIFPW